MATMACRTTGVPLTHSFTRFGASGSIAFGDGARKADAKDGIGSWLWKGAFPFPVRGSFSHGRRCEPMTVTLGKSRVRESRTPGSVRAKLNSRATRPAPLSPLAWFRTYPKQRRVRRHMLLSNSESAESEDMEGLFSCCAQHVLWMTFEIQMEHGTTI